MIDTNMFLSATGALALITAVVNLVKYVKAGNVNGWLTQVVVWVAGVATAALIAASDIAETWPVGDTTLGKASGATVILVGLGLGSAAMLTNDLKKAFDGNDSSAKPDLVKKD